MTRQYQPSPAPNIAASIPREPGSKERSMSDLSRTVVVRLAQAEYAQTAPLFAAVRKALAGEP